MIFIFCMLNDTPPQQKWVKHIQRSNHQIKPMNKLLELDRFLARGILKKGYCHVSQIIV